MKKHAVILAAVALVAPQGALATCFQSDFSVFGGKLDEDQTEAQVIAITGFAANNVSLDTCGSTSSTGAWACKIETWGSTCKGELRVYFRKNKDGVWVVNNWTATPAQGF